MKKAFILLSGFFLLLSCSGNNANEAKREMRDSMKAEIRDTPGEKKMITRQYKGTLPCADCPGIRYDLTLYNPENVGEGTFALTMDYIDRKDAKYTTTGRWTTLRGDAMDRNATVFQLRPDSVGESPMNFLYMQDSLILLDKDLKRGKSGLNYTLKMVN